MERTLFQFLRCSVLTCYDYDILILRDLIKLCYDNNEVDKHQFGTLNALLLARAEKELTVSQFDAYKSLLNLHKDG